MSETQLEMNLNPATGNRLRDALEHGDFVTLIETQVPPAEMDRDAGLQRLEALEKTVLARSEGYAALAVVDNSSRSDWRAAELASGLPGDNRDRHLVYLSGAEMDEKSVSDLLHVAAHAGLRNIAAVSGEIPEKLRTARSCSQTPFTESTDILRMLTSPPYDFYAGATVNPFQYTPYTLLGSYYKMAKKFSCGAGFLVTQAGWDMLKLQSLTWYLTGRSMFYPHIARLILLSPERADSIRSGGMPGIKLSRDMKKMLDRELTLSKNQFESVQYRRLELQAAGCRLLGFSGVQICGADIPAKAEFVLQRIRAALEEFSSFETWLDEYNAFMAGTEIAPFAGDFQLYDRVLHRNYPFDAPPETRELPEPEVSLPEKAGYFSRSFLFGETEGERPGRSGCLKRLLTGCRGCRVCHLPVKNFICHETCPMKLLNGICGDVDADGDCPVTGRECVHHRILRLAHWRNRLPEQEKLIFTDD
ncbi:MAG: methylenetetrahydrofolate reductase C-terminal domain-containing protein [Lentisphaeria bacterium]|nr:methylenetetrahydrofolate reductase C-terminal domain-containing protein [Lentisphaeria bacterium]